MLKPLLTTVTARIPALSGHPYCSTHLQSDPTPSPISSLTLYCPLKNLHFAISKPLQLPLHSHPENVLLQWEPLRLSLIHVLDLRTRGKSCVALSPHCHLQAMSFPLPFCCSNICFFRSTPFTCYPLVLIIVMPGLPELRPTTHTLTHTQILEALAPGCLSFLPTQFLKLFVYFNVHRDDTSTMF